VVGANGGPFKGLVAFNLENTDDGVIFVFMVTQKL
jgi:hypothetical protein